MEGARGFGDIADVSSEPVDASLFTAIVPAAGSGTRLGHHQPKVLFPLLGRPILDWLLDLLEPVCASGIEADTWHEKTNLMVFWIQHKSCVA